ncbi:MAG: LptF/LptG family permease [Hyphomicrobiales bacterium]
MLTRLFIVRFVAILLGVSVFVVTLDAIARSGEILVLKANAVSAVIAYALLRLPEIMSSFIAISTMLAMLLMLSELGAHSELIMIWGVGLSPFKVIVMLAPVALLVGGLHFLLEDRVIPYTARILHEWGIGDYSRKKLNIGEGDQIWLRQGTDILHARKSNPETTKLENVIIFKRNHDGTLSQQIMARQAELTNGHWMLFDVTIYYQDNREPDRITTLRYDGEFLRPAAVGARSGEPEEMSIADLGGFIENLGFGIRPVRIYQSWWHNRLTLPFICLLMVALAVPLAAKFRRCGGLGVMFALGVALGFGFFILDGLCMTLGEVGFLAPWIAAWAPIFIFAASAAIMTFRVERL